MKKIPLTQNQYSLVDDWNYDYLMQWKWHAAYNQKTKSYYAVRDEGSRILRHKIHMHRVVAKTPNDLEPDHVNHDTLDNQEHNLRNVTHAVNMENRKPFGKVNQSNISEAKIHGNMYYKVQITRNGKRIYQSNFSKLEDAITARDKFLSGNT